MNKVIKRMRRLHKIIGAGIALITGVTAAAQPIPFDPAVRTGKLANGFTYYIRHHESPVNRVQLYLVCKVGSILEDEDQLGLAHFMEHMNFNGTRHFPKNKLVDYLQKAGVQFGADLNAYTIFDETVYQLPLPAEDPALLKNGLQIMRDWAQDATLDPAEFEKERGIILEEKRLGKGAKDRMLRQYYPMLLNHSRYSDRLPIGTDSVLLYGKPAVIRRFHHDWYRPDLQALIVVGDIDVPAMEKMIHTLFSTLKNPGPGRPRTAYTVPLTGKAQFITVKDKEQASTMLSVYLKHKAPDMHTGEDYLEGIRRSLFNSMLEARRYEELSHIPDPSFLSVQAGIQSLLGGVDLFVFEVNARNGELEKAFKQGWEVVEKIKRDGFTQQELDRARQNYLRAMETAFKEKDKTPSVQLVGEYKRHFLQGEASPGIEWEYRFVKDHIQAITLQDIRTVATAYLNGADRDIVLTAPENGNQPLPGEAAIAGWIQSIGASALAAYKEKSTQSSLLVEKPATGKVISTEEVKAIAVTRMVLSNGVQVVLKPTGFKNDQVTFRAFAPGGTSLYNDVDFDAAVSADRMISSFGVGDLDPVQLTNALSGKLVKVAPFISIRSAGITGTAAPADLETGLQLVHLYFTRPRKDSVLFNKIISESRSVIPTRYVDPGNVFNDTMAYVIGHYNYRSSPPTLDKLNNISLEKSYRIYKERFADASAFTFVFVGNFDTASIRPLLEQYLGSLPALHKKETARDLGIHIPYGKMIKNVYKGKEDKALVRLVFSGDYSYDPVSNLQLHALGQILQIKLLQQLREAEGEVYSPSVQATYNKYPKNRYALIVAFGCAPANVEHLATMVQRLMDELRVKGVDAEDVQKYKASYVKNTELALKDNGFWLSYLAGQFENQENLLEVLDVQKNLEKITPASLKMAAGRFLTGENSIRFVLLPERTADN
jgi:zinc protease